MACSRKLNFAAAVIILFTGINFAAALSQEKEAEKTEKKFWTVKGYRHGTSFFEHTNYDEIKPFEKGVLDFKHYHTYKEMIWWMKKWADDYPNLIDLYTGGISFEGREIYQVTLTNKETGKDTDKPAMFIDANRHSGEVTAAESAFWMLNHLLENYGKDPEITKLVDRCTLYFRPKNNPDGSQLYLYTAQSLRSTVRPFDNDRDGLLDEDPAEDLDGDGFIRQMRLKVEIGEGQWKIDTCDVQGRIMVRAEKGEGDYKLFSEGIDNDGDGRINEDGVGGLDLHRNYPENWRPIIGRDQTGRGWTQRGAGAYPLSETETRSLVLFLLEHPNVSIMNTMDTTVPMHLRPPSTSKSEERMYPDDLKLYKHFDEKGLEITGYGRAGDVYFDYSRGRGRPLFGHSPDFGYFYYGAIWYGDELWNGGRIGDYDEDGKEDDWDKIQFNEKELLKSRFKDWTVVNHPEHGKIEVGGWNPKFWRQNPPPELLEEWIIKQANFNLMLAKSLPDVVIHEPKIKEHKNNEFTIECEVENRGYIPTALEQAQLVKIVKPDEVFVDFPEGMVHEPVEIGSYWMRESADSKVEEGEAKVEILEPESGKLSIDIDRLKGGEKKKVKFRVKFNGITGTKCTIRFSSTRGGVITREIFIGTE